MYNLTKMSLRDMSECGLALRHMGNNANNMEDVSHRIIDYLYKHLIDKESGKKSCVLVRFFKTHSYGNLTPELQESARKLLTYDVVPDNLKSLILLATAGELSAWNSRHLSVEHKVIPLASEEAIARIPMIFQLIQQLGLNPGTIVQPDPNLLTDLEQRMYNVFYIPNALGSPYIPAQTSFVIPFHVKSVVGFGGLLPSGNLFVILMFLKVVVSRFIVDLFRPLALNVKMAILPFDDGRVFSGQNQAVVNNGITTITDKDDKNETYRLYSQIATLTQLLDVSEHCTISQSDRLEKTNTHLQETLDKLKATYIQLLHTEKMSSLGRLVAGVAHEINNPVNFIYGNITHAKEYFQELIQLLELYKQEFPNPSWKIQQKTEDIEFSFLVKDLPEMLNSIKIGAERIQEIVLSLRNFSRLDEAEMKEVDIHEGIDNTLLILHHRFKANPKYPEIKIIKDYDKLPLIKCYPGELNQVFLNIINNAVDALDEILIQDKAHGRKDARQIHIRTELTSKNRVVIQITDNGLGMTEEVKQKIFDPFFTTKPIGKGTGLGLSICYQIIVQKHSGLLRCESELEKGTKFYIEIPLEQVVGIGR
ncbi:MAG: ATP-binding protein [Scytonema sp. PMC 1069.18]|nr:ATP-binding protein [Scytonema sp. PMC 1069.18]MEC4881657.1 ATP-binding protein [Scytonema sp. PMC 1070.18]